ncbi:iron-sulfur cluster repair protein YtfE [Streptosporangium jomthongense]|uniref:Hemerythrin domain-containing protein n=1 Tax=Marinobacter aromaticivorans TaxID=1494078 RepID=A0ABW2IRV8_9GAMM|nr:hemerythrin domain-containing protein [Marinobacter aromaticivorans]GGE58230.1 iron-sulfur cluster repair protein YtfE [Streptosporangium jomthongense]
MRYQSILGNCNETTVGGMIKQCPETFTVFQTYSLNMNTDRDKTVQEAAAQAGVPGKTLCRQLFDVCMEHKPLEEMETDTLLELLHTEYDAANLEQLPALHRLARKIEAVHRASPDVPQGITRAVKQLEQTLTDHVKREEAYVLSRMEHDKPPMPDTPIGQMNEEHDAIKSQLRGLRELTNHYKAPETACRSWRRLYNELKSLDFSLSEQIYLERNILFPRFQF